MRPSARRLEIALVATFLLALGASSRAMEIFSNPDSRYRSRLRGNGDVHQLRIAFVAGSLAVLALFMSGPVWAMEIWKFDTMAGGDQDTYLADLVERAEKALRTDSRPEDATAVSKLFTTNADDGVSIGMNQFMVDIALARVCRCKKITNEPNARRLEAEHALIVTLKKQDICCRKAS